MISHFLKEPLSATIELTKLIFFSENDLKKMFSFPMLICLLNHKNSLKIQEGMFGELLNKVFQFIKIDL